jgi:hypothetical protein
MIEQVSHGPNYIFRGVAVRFRRWRHCCWRADQMLQSGCCDTECRRAMENIWPRWCSRTSDFEIGKFGHAHVLRKFGQVPDDLSAL